MALGDEKQASIIAIVVSTVSVVLVLIVWLISSLLGASSDATTITNFEQCKASPDSSLQESYPEICVTSDGRTFIGPADKL